MKKIKKTLALLLVLFVFINNNVFANEEFNKSDLKFKQTAVTLLDGMNEENEIRDVINLKDISGDKNFVLFQLEHGYIIIDKITNEVIEFSLSNNNKYYKDNNKEYVYCGPLEYYEKTNDTYYNLKTKEKKTKLDKKTNINILNNKRNTILKSKDSSSKTASNNNLATSRAINLYNYKISGTLPNFDYNPNGICGSTACSNFLAYLSLNVDSRFVPSRFRNNLSSIDEIPFIKSLVPFIETSGSEALDVNKSGGSTPSGLKNGLNSYLSTEVGYLGSTYLTTSNGSTACKQINNGIPFILGLYDTDDNIYGDHWVVGISYIVTELNSTLPLYYGVIDGWGNNDVFVNVGWTDYMVVIS